MLTIVCCDIKMLKLILTKIITMTSKKKILIDFGNRVRDLRKKQGLSQEELSFKADLHRTYIGMIERAEKNISLINIEKIANALNISINEIFTNNK